MRVQSVSCPSSEDGLRLNASRPPLARLRAWRLGIAICLQPLLVACDPFHAEFEPVEAARSYSAERIKKVASASGTLTVMTYNIKFAGGRIDFFFDCHGERVLMSKAEVVAHLEQLATVINTVNPDILFLQEVDVNSK